MNNLIYGILTGCFISLLGAITLSSSLDSHAVGGVFLGSILVATGSILTLTHIIAVGVKLGNDLSKK